MTIPNALFYFDRIPQLSHDATKPKDSQAFFTGSGYDLRELYQASGVSLLENAMVSPLMS